MNKQDIQTVLDALIFADYYAPEGKEQVDDAIAILTAALAEPSGPVAYMKDGEGDYEKAFSWNFNEKTGYTIPLYTQPTTNHLDEIAKVLHYPDCWDVAAYPTLEDAIIEAKSWTHCTNEDCQCPTKETP